MSKRKATLYDMVVGQHTQGASKRSRTMSSRRRAPYITRGKKVGGVSAKPLISKISLNPYPKEFRTIITWNPPSAYISAGATNSAMQIRCNDIYDPDVTNIIGNGQPLFTDQMCSATGPYQLFRVNSWKAKWEVVNISPALATGEAQALDVYLHQGAISSTDTDTFVEVLNSPGTQSYLVGPAGTASDRKTMYLNGRLSDYVQSSIDANYNGSYNNSPGTIIYMALAVRNASTSDTAFVKYYVKVKVEYDITFFAGDGVSS